jgi:hypothetical protein
MDNKSIDRGEKFLIGRGKGKEIYVNQKEKGNGEENIKKKGYVSIEGRNRGGMRATKVCMRNKFRPEKRKVKVGILKVQ